MKSWITDIKKKNSSAKPKPVPPYYSLFSGPRPVVFQQVSAANVDDLFANRSAQVSGEGGRGPTSLASYWSRAGRSGQAERGDRES